MAGAGNDTEASGLFAGFLRSGGCFLFAAIAADAREGATGVRALRQDWRLARLAHFYRGGEMMERRLATDVRAQIIADYSACGNYSTVGRAHGVCPSTVWRIVRAAQQADGRVRPGRREQALAAHTPADEGHGAADCTGSKMADAQRFWDACMAELLKPERLAGARFSEITTAMKTVMDRFGERPAEAEALARLDKLIAGMDNAAE